ncbi:zinc finger CCCH domain-containing protein 55-like isoform X2 [Mangifera indica]|uniref:zinc finger CCCH domain-containing protein 55-like isoform X2 n=1 Tax=Mangifera indica TaxID=29780 RepID=UPI001CFB50F4|nr:zinc finger CCCH domain-containing protein 55-like isoform X2 [Mangifera indica]
MDEFDATSILFNKIRSLEPENASKIMGFILIHDFKETDLLRLALGPETLLQSLIIKAKTELGLSANTLSAPTSPSPSPIALLGNAANNNVNNNPFGKLSPRVANGLREFAKNSSLSDPKSSPFLSYENIRAGPSLLPPHLKNGGVVGESGSDFVDELQFNDYLSFLDESSKNEDFIGGRSQLGCEGKWSGDVSNVDTHFHRRSFSASDACFSSEDSNFNVGYKPCLYFSRGFCKNGDNCKFGHSHFGENDGNGFLVGSPSKMEGIYLQPEDMMRMKAALQQQRLAASQFAAGVSPPSPYDFLMRQQNDTQRVAATALLLGDELYKFGQGRAGRNDFLAMGLGEKGSSANRQIYLTFPADSTFKDEDVSNYFSTFGLVQDVRIPYQPKRMFGFVTFFYAETVRRILARGNPHFICDSRVLVKPYKEKGKVTEKQQQFDRGSLSPCSTPSGDSRDSYDPLGAKVFFKTQDMLLRRKFDEQLELQQAIEFQRKRLLNLQVPNLTNQPINHHQHSLSIGNPVTLPAYNDINHNLILRTGGINQEVLEGGSSNSNVPSTVAAGTELYAQLEVDEACLQKDGSGDRKEESSNPLGCDFHERGHSSSIELTLPDNLFASTKKPAEGSTPNLSPAIAVKSTGISATPSSEINIETPNTSVTDMASH